MKAWSFFLQFRCPVFHLIFESPFLLCTWWLSNKLTGLHTITMEGAFFSLKSSSSSSYSFSSMALYVICHCWFDFFIVRRSCVAIAGADYCVIAADTRMSTGYSILTREYSKICKLYVFLSSWFPFVFVDWTAKYAYLLSLCCNGVLPELWTLWFSGILGFELSC